VVVVGAGPAGCSAAHFAAVKGSTVLLIDMKRFPRDKVCGDGISPRSLAVLDRIGVSQRIEASGGVKVNEVLVSSPNGATMRSRIPDVPGFRNYGLVLSRKTFDHLLFDHVSTSANVDALLDSKVIDLSRKDGFVKGVTVSRQGGPSTFRPRLSLVRMAPILLWLERCR